MRILNGTQAIPAIQAIPVSAAPKFHCRPVRTDELIRANSNVLRETFSRGLAFHRTAFEARLTRINRVGDAVDLGPDYRTRIAAMYSLLNACTRGRQPLKPLIPEDPLTMENLRAYVKYREQGSPVAPKPEQPLPIAEPDNGIAPIERVGNDSAELRICDLVNSHAPEIEELFAIGLASLEGVFSARLLSLDSNGDIVDLGPDYGSGLAAFKLPVDISTRGRTPLPFPPQPQKISKDPTPALFKEMAIKAKNRQARMAAGQPDEKQFDY